MLSFSPRDVLNEILNLTESVSEGFPTDNIIIILSDRQIVQVPKSSGFSCPNGVFFHVSQSLPTYFSCPFCTRASQYVTSLSHFR